MSFGGTFQPRQPGQVPSYAPALSLKKANIVMDAARPTLRTTPSPVPRGQTVPAGGSLATAVANAPEGATILIPAGKYAESLNITKSISLVAEGKVTILGDGSSETISTNASVVSFSGLYIKQKKIRSRPAVSVSGGGATFSNCKIYSTAVCSLLLKGDAFVTLDGTVVKGSISPCVNLTGSTNMIARQSVFQGAKVATVNVKGTSIAEFSECLFKDNAKVAVSTIDQSAVLIDCCKFMGCSIEIANDSSNNLVRGCVIEKTASESGIIIAGTTTCTICNTDVNECAVDVRDNAMAELISNNFVKASLIVWGSSRANSVMDTFRGDVIAAIAVSQYASCTATELKLVSVQGDGVACFGGGTAVIQKAMVNGIKGSAVNCHTGGSVTLTDSDISACGNFGVIANEARQVQISTTMIKGCIKSGIEITRGEQVTLSEVKCHGHKKCGIMLIDTRASIDKCEFHGCGYSGAHLRGSSSALADCTFAKNEKGGAMITNGSVINAVRQSFKDHAVVGLFIDAESHVEIAQSSFTTNAHGLVTAGRCDVVDGTFANNTVCGMQVTGVSGIQGGSFTGEKRALLVTGSEGRGQLTASETTFTKNASHLETVDRGTVSCTGCQFTGSTGPSGVQVVDSAGAFRQCTFTNSSQIAMLLQGNVEVSDSTITGSSRAGIVFDGCSAGSVSSSRLENNGDCAILCLKGTPSLLGNTITGGVLGKFGVYMTNDAAVTIEGNTFSQNSCANIWRQ